MNMVAPDGPFQDADPDLCGSAWSSLKGTGWDMPQVGGLKSRIMVIYIYIYRYVYIYIYGVYSDINVIMEQTKLHTWA